MKTKKTEQNKNINKPLFYDFRWVLSKNRLFNIIMGLRGGGKTYGATKMIINRYLRKKYQTIWVRRLATEIDSVFLDGFFRDMELNNEFPNYQFKTNKTDIEGIAYGYIKEKNNPNSKWEKFIMFLPLSIALKHKSVVMNDYNLIICDEWFIDTLNTNLRYIKGWNEPYIFYEFFESVNRSRNDVRVLMLSNAISSVNPYFSEWGVKIDNNTEWWLNDFICVHNYKNENFKQNKLTTQWGKFINNTRYGKYNIENEFLNDDYHFIENKSKDSKWLFNIVYGGKTYGVWVDEKLGKMYVCKAIMDYGKCYCFSGEDLKPNMYLIDSINNKTNVICTTLKNAFKHTYLYYENLEIKTKMYELMGVLAI